MRKNSCNPKNAPGRSHACEQSINGLIDARLLRFYGSTAIKATADPEVIILDAKLPRPSRSPEVTFRYLPSGPFIVGHYIDWQGDRRNICVPASNFTCWRAHGDAGKCQKLSWRKHSNPVSPRHEASQAILSVLETLVLDVCFGALVLDVIEPPGGVYSYGRKWIF